MTSVLFNDCTAFEKYLLKSSLSEDSIDIFTLNKKTIKEEIGIFKGGLRKGQIKTRNKIIEDKNRPKYKNSKVIDYDRPIYEKKKPILQGDRIEHIDYIKDKNLKLDYEFYITNQIMNPVKQVLDLEMDSKETEKLFLK